MPLLIILALIIVLVISTKKEDTKKTSKFVKILALPSGELIKIRRNDFKKLRHHNKLKWNKSYKYWTIKDKNRKDI